MVELAIPIDLDSNRPIRDQIAAALREAIVSLRLRPGDVLVERDLCERTGASRPSVREALRQLESEGLVVSRIGHGTVVRTLTREEARDVYEIRGELEGFAARLFCQRADLVTRTRLDAALKRLTIAITQDDSPVAVLAAQEEFYQVLFEGAGNPLLDQLVTGLKSRAVPLRVRTLAVAGRPRQFLAELEQIVNRIHRGDPAGAQRAAARHVRRAARVMEDLFDRDEGSVN